MVVVLSVAGLLAAAGTPFTVAVDPGHGGTNLGARADAGSVAEKHVTLEIARRIRQHLASDKGIRVVLCRDRDVLLPLRARVRCANESGARLFLSLHANASPEGPRRGTQRGFELYVMPAAGVDHDAAVAAVAAPTDADAAWAAHRVRETALESLAAARRIAWQLADALGADRDRGIKQGPARLDVLQGVNIPAVLVEVGFLDHPEEGPLLVSERGLDAVAAALARAITDVRAREVRGRADPSITATRPRRREKQ